jgi:hypothetical protein
MQTLETLFLYASTVVFSISTFAACALGRKSQLPPAAVALVAILSASGLVIIFTR